MPSNKGILSFGSGDRSMTASATGNNINVVAVFEIHIDRMQAAAMNPNTILRLLTPPKKFTMLSATRRWAPLLSIA